MLSADLSGRHAIVTGASCGLGLQLVEVLTLAARRLDALEMVKSGLAGLAQTPRWSGWTRRPPARLPRDLPTFSKGHGIMEKMPLLFTPLQIAGATLRNRVVLSPMCQYCAIGGYADDWHLVHLGKFALGGMGLVFTEATAVEERGRISYGDLGIWSDTFVPGLKRIADFVRTQGALPGIQIAHAGRKGGWQRPWQGGGPLNAVDVARGEPAYALVGPTAEALAPGHTTPHALSPAEIAGVVENFASAAARADRAGFEALEIHGAHGYLISSFLSPGVNRRNDAYGGDRAGRMRLALEVTRAVRAGWPASKPLFFRISSVDGAPGGWAIEDSIALAEELGKAGVDVVDCSSGGMRGATAYENSSRKPGFQVGYASDIRKATGMKTMAVGHILDARQAEAVLAEGHADLTAIGRQAMYDPYWPHHAAQAFSADPDFKRWNDQAGWWLAIRRRGLEKVGFGPDGRPLPMAEAVALVRELQGEGKC